MQRRVVDITELYYAIDKRRSVRGITWAQVSTETGLAAPLFSRMAAGRTVSIEGYLTLCKWLDIETPFSRIGD